MREEEETYYDLTNSVSSNVATTCLIQQRSTIVGCFVNAMFDVLAHHCPVHIFMLISVSLPPPHAFPRCSTFRPVPSHFRPDFVPFLPSRRGELSPPTDYVSAGVLI